MEVVDHAAFAPGSVKKVELTNFMTHKHIVYYPSANVNFLLGANGSGKSSIVCALCLGLGGAARHMVRGSKLSDFILTGTSKAEIEITLTGMPSHKGDFVILRVLNAGAAASRWYVNDVAHSEEAVASLLSDVFHINMDNPCMFLPQEKVSTFSYMTPSQVLSATMKSIDPRIGAQFASIVARQREVAMAVRSVSDKRVQKEELERKMARLERDKEQVEKYESLKHQIRLLEWRLPYARLHDADEERRTAMAALQALEEEGRTLAGSLEEPEARLAAARQGLAVAEGARDGADAAMKGAVAALDKCHHDISSKLRNVTNAQHELRAAQESMANAAAALEEAQRRCSVAEGLVQTEAERLSSMKPPPPAAVVGGVKAELAAARADLDDARRRREMHARQLSNRKVELHAAMAKGGKREQVVRASRFPTAVVAMKALDYIRREAERGAWRGPILGPVILSVEAVEPRFNVFVENGLSAFDKFLFIASEEADRRRLADYKVDRSGHANTFRMEPSAVDKFQPATAPTRLTPDVMSHISEVIGSPCYRLCDVIRCDKLVMAALIYQSHIQDCVVCPAPDAATRYLEAQKDTARVALNVPDRVQFLTPDARFSKSTSTYTHEVVMTRGSMRPVEFVGHAVGRGEEVSGLEVAVAEVEAACKVADAEVAAANHVVVEVESRLAALQREVDAHSRQKLALTTARGAHKAAEAAVAELRATHQNPDKQKAWLRAKYAHLRQLQLEVVNMMAALPTFMAAVTDATTRAVGASMAVAQADATARQASRDVAAAKQSMQTYETRVKAARVVVERAVDMHEEMARAWNAVKKVIAKTPKAFDELDKLPTTAGEVSELLNECQHSVNSMLISQDAVREYHQTRHALAQVTEEHDGMVAALEREQSETLADIREWAEGLEDRVHLIGQAFRAGMSKIHVASDVSLSYDEAELEKAGIEIKVAFRATDRLQILNKEIQSGGERASTTMMYLLAMQTVTPLPFRIVDEINQGMDAKNERAVLETLLTVSASQVAHAITASGSAPSAGAGATPASSRQLFIVSPKLLSDLVHSPFLRCAIVFNGNHIYPPAPKSGERLAARFLDFCTIAKAAGGKGTMPALPLRSGHSENGEGGGVGGVGSKRAPAVMSGGGRRGATDEEEEEEGGGGGAGAGAGAEVGSIAKRPRLVHSGDGRGGHQSSEGGRGDEDGDMFDQE